MYTVFIALVMLGIHLMNVELDAADAKMRAEPVPSVQEALDARERFDVPIVVGPDAIGDAAPPSTRIMICGGSLPATSVRDNADGSGCHIYDVGSTDRANPDLLNRNDDDEFRHGYYISGDPACVGTGKPVQSGRDCGPGEAEQCLYVAEGFSIYAVSGGSCSEHAIGLCEGIFCR